MNKQFGNSTGPAVRMPQSSGLLFVTVIFAISLGCSLTFGLGSASILDIIQTQESFLPTNCTIQSGPEEEMGSLVWNVSHDFENTTLIETFPFYKEWLQQGGFSFYLAKYENGTHPCWISPAASDATWELVPYTEKSRFQTIYLVCWGVVGLDIAIACGSFLWLLGIRTVCGIFWGSRPFRFKIRRFCEFSIKI